MSGGSFNYLYSLDDRGDNLDDRSDDIRLMAGWLLQHGFDYAAHVTVQALTIYHQGERDLANEVAGRLKNLWKCVEWCDSGDSTMVPVFKAHADWMVTESLDHREIEVQCPWEERNQTDIVDSIKEAIERRVR